MGIPKLMFAASVKSWKKWTAVAELLLQRRKSKRFCSLQLWNTREVVRGPKWDLGSFDFMKTIITKSKKYTIKCTVIQDTRENKANKEDKVYYQISTLIHFEHQYSCEPKGYVKAHKNIASLIYHSLFMSKTNNTVFSPRWACLSIQFTCGLRLMA